MTVPACSSGAFVPGPVCERGPTGSGALGGVRLAVKDLIDVQGAATGAGNPDWAASHPAAATADAACVAALRAAGARVVGKTITDELAFSLEGENAFHGTPRHPVQADRLPGGSSSGSVVAVAWGEADVALGTDTGGSVRVPASFCGVAAMRPTHGRVPLAGVLPFAPSYDTVGWFARDAALLRSAGHALLGRTAASGRSPLRLCIAEDAVALADAPVREALHGWAQRAGIHETRQAFTGEWATWAQAYAELQGHEIAAQLGPWIRQTRPTFGAAIAPRFQQALALDTAQRPRWQAWRVQAAQRLVQQLGADEAWLVPAAPCVALQKSADADERAFFYSRALALGSLAGHAGLPQVVLPLASAQGLPVGISFIAAPGQDERLLDLAMAFSENGRTS
ncbi:amidase [Hydrogenophaga palleronii]|uniref:amidase n=1 Tax=Hydrogenophaga palleronii TaxID=65655 RepID=UPI0008249055|nr:amidase [Hydrogenophaga palleronii]